MVCVICKKEYEGYGNNAEPIAKGMCCDNCNTTYVIPARLKQLKVENKLKDSTLQEYEDVRKNLGEEKWKALMNYLDAHKDILLSDVIYKQAEFEKFEKWLKNNMRDDDAQLRRYTSDLIREEVNAVEQYDDTMRENKLTPEQQTTLEEIRNDEIDHTDKLNNIYQGLKEGAEELHDAEQIPHISKEVWNKIPSDYKMIDPKTKKKMAFAGSLGIAPGGTTLLTEGKHFIIDESGLEESFDGEYVPADVNEPIEAQDGILENIGKIGKIAKKFVGYSTVAEDSNNLEESAFDVGTFNGGQSGDVSQKENEEMIENLKDDVQEVQPTLEENEISNSVEDAKMKDSTAWLDFDEDAASKEEYKRVAAKYGLNVLQFKLTSALVSGSKEGIRRFVTSSFYGASPSDWKEVYEPDIKDAKCKDANIHPDDLRRFCIKHNYYTHGSISDYDNLLYQISNKGSLEEIAMDIAAHSEGVLASEVLVNLKREFKNAVQDNDEVYGDGEEVEEQIEALSENTVEARDSGEYTIEINGEIYEDQFGNPYHFNSYNDAMEFIEEHELKGAVVTRQYGKSRDSSMRDSDTVNDIGMYAKGSKYRWDAKYGNAQLTLMCVCEDDTIKLSLDNADMYVKIPREKFEGMLRDGIIVATDTLRIDGYDRIKTKDSKFSVKVAGRRFIVKAKDSKTARDKVRKMLRGK